MGNKGFKYYESLEYEDRVKLKEEYSSFNKEVYEEDFYKWLEGMRKTIISKMKTKVKSLETVGKKVVNLESFIRVNGGSLHGTLKLSKAEKDLEKLRGKDQDLSRAIEEFINEFSVTEEEFYESGMGDIGYNYEEWLG